jgi:hypothetical protein
MTLIHKKVSEKGSSKIKNKNLFKQAIIYDRLVEQGLIFNLNLPELIFPEYLLKEVRKERHSWTGYFRKKSVNRFLIRVPAFCKSCYGADPLVVREFLRNYITTYESLCITKGPSYAVKWLKSLHSLTGRHLCNHKHEKISYLSYQKNGLPSILYPLNNMISGTISDRQCVYFLVQLYKLAKVTNTEDLSIDTILHKEEHDTSNHLLEGSYLHKAALESGLTKKEATQISNYFCDVLEEMFPIDKTEHRLSEIRDMNTVHISTRNGPNGLSLLTAPIDWIAVRKDKVLSNAIIEMSRLLGNKSLNMILGCFRLMKTKIIETNRENNPLTSKLSTKVEPGGKMRVFAIGDWFSQSVLKGYHSYIFTKLYSYSNDGTNSHSDLSEKVKLWTTDSAINIQGIYSVDLTAATDLLSCLFQREIVMRVAGNRFGKLWYTIMSKRKFRFNDLGLDDVQYAKGQPMGLYSSWGMLALSHHVICRTALKLANISYDKQDIQFGIIGDDIALYGYDFYQKYILLMSTLLKVPINGMKGFTPNTVSEDNPLDENMTNVVEIAKRIFYNGEELTTVTPVSAKAGLERSEDFPSLLNELCSRGLVHILSTPQCVQLARLGFNPKLALELSTFPPLPSVPFSGVGMAKLEELPSEFDTIPWVKDRINTDYLLIELCKTLRVKIIPNLRKSLMSILEYKYKRETWISHGYTYESDPFVYLLRLASKELTNRLNLVDIKTKGDTLTFNVKDLRKLLDSVNVCSDVDLLLNDKSRDNKDTKGKTSVLIKKIIRSVSLEVSASFESRYSVSPDIINLLKESTLIKPVILVNETSSDFVITRIDDDIISLEMPDDYGDWDITIE